LPLHLDATDIAIIKSLLKDGRKSFRQISRETGITTLTVKARYERLVDIGFIKGVLPVFDFNKVDETQDIIQIKNINKDIKIEKENFDKNDGNNIVIGNIAVGIERHQIVLKKPYIRILLDNIDNDVNTIYNDKNTSDKTITNPIYIEIVNDPYEIQKGLMFRKNLEWNNGMLFVFDDEQYRSFWMKNTYIALDIIFIDKNFQIVDIKENAKPCLSNKCPSYASKVPAKYVLEVNSDFVNKNKIQIGNKLII
jgi:uncharacterized membrane protein (UPF0127 family)/DNA-binding transcriptional regulator YhcF (GntR family)